MLMCLVYNDINPLACSSCLAQTCN